MKKNYLFYAIAILIFNVSQLKSQQPTVLTYTYTGTMQSFTVPSCVASISLDVKGAQGGPNAAATTTGGLGGSAFGVISVTQGDVLNIFVGGMNGYNGGGLTGTSPCTLAMGGPGGGASDIRLNGMALNNRVIVGAGGGGGGGDRIQGCGRGTGGGGGGGYYGGGGGAGYTNTSSVATGGTQTSGGSGGVTQGAGISGSAGSLGQGGNGGGEYSSNQAGTNVSVNGGAGGGLNGSNGNNPGSPLIYVGSSGAGGSSYVSSTLSNTSTTAGNRIGHGIVSISYVQTGGVVSGSATPQAICTGTTASLTSNPGFVSYTWQPGNIQTQNTTVSPTITTNYTVMATNTLGCISAEVVPVTVYSAAPVVSISSSTNASCPGQTVMLTASGAASYSWTGGISNGVAFSPNSTNTYSVTGYNACGTDVAFVTVTVTPLPVFAIATPTIVCAAKPATLTAGGAPNYTWTPGNNLTGNSIVVAPTVTTIYTVTGSDGICAGFHTVEVTTKPNPTITVAASSSVICAGDVINITASGADTYTWNPSTITGSSGTVSPLIPTLYQVSGTNSVGCISSQQQVVLVNPSPTMNIAPSHTSICVGSTATLNVTGNGHVYQWSGGPQASTHTVSPSVTTTYSVTGSYTTNNICTSTSVITISAYHATLSVTAPATVCPGTSVTLSAGHGSNYNWSTMETTQNIVVVPTAPTMYTVSATTFSNNITCVAQNSVYLDVYPETNVTAQTTSANICRGHTATLSATGANSYKWTGPMTSTQASFTFSSNIATTYTFIVTGTDDNGCTDTDQIVISVGTCVGLHENEAALVKTYPNPSQGSFVIESVSDINITISNSLGQVVKQLQLDSKNNHKGNVNDLPDGLYFITVDGNNKNTAHRMIISK